MTRLLKSALEFLEKNQKQPGKIGEIWRAMKLESYVLSVIRKVADPKERLKEYDAFAIYLED